MGENSFVKWVFLIVITNYVVFTIGFSSDFPILTKNTYIIQMDKSAMPESFSSHLDWYSSKVKSILVEPETEGDDDQDRIIYSYQNAFHGVAARLSEEEAERLEEEDGVVAVFPDTKIVSGVSLYKGRRALLEKTEYALVYMGTNSSNPEPSSLCLEGTLDPHVVSGKIVICDRGISPRVQKGQVVKDAGGVGMILTNTASNGEELVADCHLIPAVAVGEIEGRLIKHYVLTNPKASATLAFLGTRLGIKPSPVVAAFSSRGPNLLTLEILKPDIVAPGVNILASWTAYVHDNTHKPLRDASASTSSSPFDHGAGHINPVKALDPGLVYDIEAQDYFEFLCTQNLTPMQLRIFGKYSNRTCKHTLASPGDLNYPAISVVFPEKTSGTTMTLHRTVTNVGSPVSNYHAVVSQFKGCSVTVEPTALNFTGKHQKLSYKITFKTKSQQTIPEFGGLIWKDAVHKVRSPIVVTWLLPL
ncbi:hypothetical protein Q3G72_024762 [Acer saccharum]|nr:hypothetical protein Q3G72_024762 [Acer saccharum]